MGRRDRLAEVEREGCEEESSYKLALENLKDRARVGVLLGLKGMRG